MADDAVTSEAMITAIHYAAIAAPLHFDPALFQLFQRALNPSDVDVRRAAILGLGYLEQKEFGDILHQLIISDPDQAAREDSRLMLEGLEEGEKVDE